MRFLIQSDLHLERDLPYERPEGDYDAVILAGDTHTGTQGVKWAAETWPGKPVIYLLGNHEYYRNNWDTLVAETRAAAAPNVSVLEMDEVVLGGVRILGATMWSDMKLGGDTPAGWWAEKGMNDYRLIYSAGGIGRILTAAQTMARHDQTINWLQAKLKEPFSGPTVVVTHHAPSAQGCGWRQSGGMGIAYASDLDEMVAQSGAVAWIHGHTHVDRIYTCGSVPVISNARGYKGEIDAAWKSDFLMEVRPKDILIEGWWPKSSGTEENKDS